MVLSASGLRFSVYPMLPDGKLSIAFKVQGDDRVRGDAW